ncbi:vWA domain-containing protein [Halorientalis marina]|uniref:vWA domain-containing protein n=1 Tax=Halorientalis marina TaxID=2931976 RepID=UPI001FF65FEF|nr:VWA domain-containing protein [Halorientalis marina]
MSENQDSQAEFADQPPTNVARVPTLLLLDTSRSMDQKTKDEDGNRRPKIDQLNEGLKLFKQEIDDDFKAERAVDISLVTFGGDVSVEQEFSEIEDWQPPNLSASGGTPLCEALVKGANHLRDHRNDLRDDKVPLKKALVWVLTDGRPTDDRGSKWDKAQTVVEDGTEDGELLFYAVGIGEEANMSKLEDLASAAPDESKVNTFQLESGMFKEFFRIVSESAQAQSEGGDAEEADDNLTQQ